jgi:hypothetical protein
MFLGQTVGGKSCFVGCMARFMVIPSVLSEEDKNKLIGKLILLSTFESRPCFEMDPKHNIKIEWNFPWYNFSQKLSSLTSALLSG